MSGNTPTSADGRAATRPYRVRVGGIWYWVDPTVPPGALEAGDTVVAYPAGETALLAVLRGGFMPGKAEPEARIAFAAISGEPFEIAARDIVALHLAAVDEVQT